MKVLITTSGLGSRLGDITKYTNKSLVKIGDKAAICHIIDSYPNASFVVTLGHFGNYVKQFLEMCYPNRNFEFVTVDPYAGPGSSLLRSMHFAKDFLQCPFVFHACDTIVKDKIPETWDANWMACGKSDRSEAFRTLNITNGIVTKINEKGEIGYDYAYIGIAGVKDYEQFWFELESILSNTESTEVSDCHVFMRMLTKTKVVPLVIKEWYDTGNVETLTKTCTAFKSTYNVLDKHEESIYFIDDSVIKFFSDATICRNRVKRASYLGGLIPTLEASSDNFYKYKLATGHLLSHVVSEQRITDLVHWAENSLWTPVNDNGFKDKCTDFYLTKTKSRIQKYLSIAKDTDRPTIINGTEIPSCETIMNKINWNRMCNTNPVRFHGDFILDNILYDNGKFVLLDWRQDFAGSIESGDKYYDLAKLNHNLVFNHEIVSNGGYSISVNGEVHCDIMRSHNLTLCQQTLMKVLEQKGYDIHRIKMLTSLIWINMSPLHTYPLNKFLFYFGKYNLWREVCLTQ